MNWFLVFVFSCYAILIISLAFGFKRVDEFKAENNIKKTTFSIIIPFRNEAENLPALLKSISKMNYPEELVEFILVDDDSSDNSVEVINAFLSVFLNEKQVENQKNEITLANIRVVNNKRNSNSPKKDAILTAISEAKNSWIVTTDADCILPNNWLKTLNTFIQKNTPEMVVAPVNYSVQNNFLEQFQLLDFMSLQGTTIGSFGINYPFLCNGANLAYKKETFQKLNGFSGNDNIASGDDVFLFEKFLAHNKQCVHYLKSKEAIVTTFPVLSWSHLINQRTRWAAKTSELKSLTIKLIGFLVLITNFLLVITFFINSIKTIVALFTFKLIVDLFLFTQTIKFFKQKNNFIKWYLIASFLYPFFSVFITLKALLFRYEWKGRAFKK